MKALSIIGIILSVIFLIWFVVFTFEDPEITGAGRISMAEFFLVGFTYGLFGLAFSIVSTVYSFRRK